MAAYGLISRALITTLILFVSLIEAKPPSEESKAAVAHYLMPSDHPLKPDLDALFSSARVTLNLESLKRAGFDKTNPRKFTKLIVTKHHAFPGYIFKLYLDAQRPHKGLSEHHYWVLRVKGAEKIRREIAAHCLEALFKVPQKWIYPLPSNHLPPSGYYPKYYILVEEDMDILSDHENKETWASDAVTTELLDHLFMILKKLGLRDCAKPDNIPFSIDGRLAFIDTQTHNCKHVNYKKLTPYLSKSNRDYWKALIED